MLPLLSMLNKLPSQHINIPFSARQIYEKGIIFTLQMNKPKLSDSITVSTVSGPVKIRNHVGMLLTVLLSRAAVLERGLD